MRGSNKGFTLIELVIVLVLIGILAAVAIPRFHDMKTNAEEASIRGTLGNVRSAITIWRANELANGNNAWPLLTEVYGAATQEILDTPIPDNPWATGGPDGVVVAGAVKGTATGSADGWAYRAATGEFWANSDGNGEAAW